MRASHLPINSLLAGAIRDLWPERAPSVELRTRTMFGAVEALRQQRGNKAKIPAQRLAVAVYVLGVLLISMTLVSFSSLFLPPIPPTVRWLIIGVLALGSIVSGALSVSLASSWLRTMRLPHSLRWAPLASLLGVLAITAGVVTRTSATSAIDAQHQAGMPAGLHTSMDLVSHALTRTMTISQSQVWLDSRLPANVERAWFVTPEGLIALSSITTANEISRSVMDYIAITAITQTAIAQYSGLTRNDVSADMPAIASLQGRETLTRAIVVSTTPVVLLVMVRQALVNLSHTPRDAQIYTQPVQHADGTLAGISAIAWQPTRLLVAGESIALIAAGFIIICLAWAVWVYLAEEARFRNRRSLRVQPLRWAILTALLLPIGLLTYLLSRSDEG